MWQTSSFNICSVQSVLWKREKKREINISVLLVSQGMPHKTDKCDLNVIRATFN